MINEINTTQSSHIITRRSNRILHKHDKSMINQREIGMTVKVTQKH